MATTVETTRRPVRVPFAARAGRWLATPRRPAAILGVTGFVVGWLGSWNPSYWGDEAASVMSAERPLRSLAAELGHVDAVHGVYYLFLHFWIDAFGASELSTRFPSAIAAGLLVAGVVVLGYRLSGARLGITAGLIAVALARVTDMATEARSYAMASALAVWVTLLFVRLWRARTPRRRLEYVLYGIAVGLSAYLFLYLALLVVVHAAVVLLSREGRARWRRWLLALPGVLVVSLPIAVVAYAERAQVAFLAKRAYATPSNVLVRQWFGTDAEAAICWALIAVAVLVAASRLLARRRVPDRRATLLAICWLAVPTVLILIGDRISPMYNIRYLSFSAPAAAILVALGAIRIGEFATAALRGTRLRGVPLAVPVLTVLAVVAAVAVPGYLAQRGPYAKDSGSDLRQTAQYVASVARPGDAIVFDQDIKASRKPRLGLHLYPQDYAGLRDVGLVTPYSQRPGLWDAVAPVPSLGTRALGPVVWAVEIPTPGVTPPDVAALVADGYTQTSEHLVHRSVVYGFTLESP